MLKSKCAVVVLLGLLFVSQQARSDEDLIVSLSWAGIVEGPEGDSILGEGEVNLWLYYGYTIKLGVKRVEDKKWLFPTGTVGIGMGHWDDWLAQTRLNPESLIYSGMWLARAHIYDEYGNPIGKSNIVIFDNESI